MYKSDPTFAVSVFQDTLLPLLGLPNLVLSTGAPPCPSVSTSRSFSLSARLLVCSPPGRSASVASQSLSRARALARSLASLVPATAAAGHVSRSKRSLIATALAAHQYLLSLDAAAQRTLNPFGFSCCCQERGLPGQTGQRDTKGERGSAPAVSNFLRPFSQLRCRNSGGRKERACRVQPQPGERCPSGSRCVGPHDESVYLVQPFRPPSSVRTTAVASSSLVFSHVCALKS